MAYTNAFGHHSSSSYTIVINLKDLLVHADCEIKPSCKQATRLLPFLKLPRTIISPGTKQTTITQFFKKRLITSSSSLTDLTPKVDSQVHKSQSMTVSSKPPRRKCTYR